MLDDLRFAFRSLSRSPGFVVAVLLTLALGIGINTSTFSVQNALMFRPLPYPDAQQLVRLTVSKPQNFNPNFSPADFLDVRAAATSFSEVVLAGAAPASLSVEGEPAEQVMCASATPDFFSFLRVSPHIGRGFVEAEGHKGNDDVLVLSYRLWTRRYHGDPAVLGRVIKLDGRPMKIVGVMSPAAEDTLTWGPTDCWRLQLFDDGTGNVRETAWLTVYARLKSDVPLASAQAELDGIAARLAHDHPNLHTGLRIHATLLDAGRRTGPGASLVWLITGLALAVLLIACANLANLQLSRALSLERDYGIRLALGASRWRLIRHLLAESLLLAVGGAPLGLLLALGGNKLIGRHIPISYGETLAVPIDWRVLGFAVTTSVLTGLAFGLAPSLFAARTDVNRALKLGASNATSDRSRHRLRDTLIVAEIALSLMLLVGASFFTRGLFSITHRNLGWDPDRLATGVISLPWAKYPNEEGVRPVCERLLGELQALPGVEHAALTQNSPAFGGGPLFFTLEKPPAGAPNTPMPAVANSVTPDYFNTVAQRLLRGRGFTEHDRPGAPAVAIINESMARNLWPDRDALGERIVVAGPQNAGPCEIIGIVGDAQPATNFTNQQPFLLYRPLAQVPTHWFTIAVRSQHDQPALLAHSVREAVHRADPDLAVLNLSTARADMELVGASFLTITYTVSVFSVFGILLMAVGLYGVIARLVHQRTREIGVRLALGATPRQVVALVVRHGLLLAAIGSVAGVAGGYGTVRLCASVLPGFPGMDWTLFASAAGALVALAVVACWLPARRAARVDPMVALRAE